MDENENNMEEFYAHLWHKKWPDEILNAPELLSRRKRSHNLNLISLDRSIPEAVFLSGNKDARLKGNTYITRLTKCTCTDFLRGHGKYPCKHIFRLAEELGLLKNEHFGANEHDYTLEQNVLPETLYDAGDELIEKYIMILRLIFKGRKNCIKRLEKTLTELAQSDTNEEKENSKQKLLRNRLQSYYAFRDEAREIKQYKLKDEKDELLEQLVSDGLIEVIEKDTTVSVRIPQSMTLNQIEKIISFYGENIPLFSQKIAHNPFNILSEITNTKRRSEEILRPHNATSTPNWAFRVPECFNDALDIKLTFRTKNFVEYAVWTQGINFAFDVGDVIYRDNDSYEKGTPALQIIGSKKAQGTTPEIEDTTIDIEENDDGIAYKDYYPGEVIYRDFESGNTKTMTQMDFVKMLIGNN